MNHRMKSFLKRTPIYPLYCRFVRPHVVARRLLHQFHTWSHEDEERLKFYRQFVKHGDIVFDVGVNVGNRTKVFLKLGAQVVGYEPQQICVEFLNRVLRSHPHFQLVQKALGAQVGETQMLISDTHTISSMSPRWIESVKRSGRFGKEEWNKSQPVEITTLDLAIQEHGRPAFIKIDVEGYEYEVLSGLSEVIDMISIEFTPEYLDNTFKCIDHLSSLSTELEFQISIGESMEWHLPVWVAKSQIKDALLQLPARKFGDLYIRTSRTPPSS